MNLRRVLNGETAKIYAAVVTNVLSDPGVSLDVLQSPEELVIHSCMVPCCCAPTTVT